MDITFIGHSSFRIKGKSASVVTDPFDSKSVGLNFPKVNADIVTISHDHDDHNKHELVKDVRKVVAGPGEYEIMGISIIGIRTFHDNKKGKDRGVNTIYLMEIDGMHLVHLGDLGHGLEQKVIEDIGDVDVLMIPVGGEYTIDHTLAAKIVQTIEPRITIPMHYQMKGLNKATFAKLTGVDDFVKEVGLPVEKTDKLSVKAFSQPEEQKVVVLSSNQ